MRKFLSCIKKQSILSVHIATESFLLVQDCQFIAMRYVLFLFNHAFRYIKKSWTKFPMPYLIGIVQSSTFME